MKNTYSPNSLLHILYTSLALMLIYRRCKSTLAPRRQIFLRHSWVRNHLNQLTNSVLKIWITYETNQRC